MAVNSTIQAFACNSIDHNVGVGLPNGCQADGILQAGRVD